MDKKPSKLSILTKGIIKENPVLVLLLGTCPTLATTSSAINGMGMGVSAMAVLICSNIVISLLRNIIPDKVRIPCYIVVIAGFVTLVQFVLQAYAPDINKALGVFIPLIVVNCIILGRAEAFANKNSVVDSALAGIGMGKKSALTKDVQKAIEDADVLIGAERMISAYDAKIDKKAYYKAEQIIPYLEKLQRTVEGKRCKKIVILFSGDSGFHAG